MPRHSYREDKTKPWLCDITSSECDYPKEMGVRYCKDCKHYLKWKQSGQG